MILGVLAACFLILPQRVQSVNNTKQEKISQISEESDSKSAQILSYESQIKGLNEQIEALQSQVTDYEGVDSTSAAMNSLMEAVNIYLGNPSDIEGMATALENVDLNAISDDVSPEFTGLYNTLMSHVGTQLAVNYYNTGYEAYKTKDYETAITNLSKAYQYDNTNVNTLYYLGNSYYENGDFDKAKEVYDSVITNFPGTQSATAAQTKLAEINNSGN